jgi:hypothetical protein
MAATIAGQFAEAPAAAKGFSLCMVKAAMSRGDELIDLARANLWR